MTTINLELTDPTGKQHLVQLQIHEAKKLYLGLREIFGDYERPNPELFTTIPEVRLDVSQFKRG